MGDNKTGMVSLYFELVKKVNFFLFPEMGEFSDFRGICEATPLQTPCNSLAGFFL